MISIEDASHSPLDSIVADDDTLLGDTVNAVPVTSSPPPSQFQPTNNDTKRDRIPPDIISTFTTTKPSGFDDIGHATYNTGFTNNNNYLSTLPISHNTGSPCSDNSINLPITTNAGFSLPIRRNTGLQYSNDNTTIPITTNTGLNNNDNNNNILPIKSPDNNTNTISSADTPSDNAAQYSKDLYADDEESIVQNESQYDEDRYDGRDSFHEDVLYDNGDCYDGGNRSCDEGSYDIDDNDYDEGS